MRKVDKTTRLLRRLRSKIVVAIMVSSGIVIMVAMASVLALTYRTNYQDIGDALEKACTLGPDETVLYSVGRSAGKSAVDRPERSGGPYMPTAVFLVDDDGDVVASNEDFVTMDDTVRDAAIKAALASSNAEGHIADASVFYKRVAVTGGYVVAFADTTAFDATITRAATLLALASALFLAALLVVSEIIARLVTRPVQHAWEQQANFIADASHELKTPLTVLIANNEIMLAHPEFTAQERATWLEGSRVEAEHMRGLIEDMLTLARDEATSPADQLGAMASVDLSALVERASLAFDAVAFERGVTVREDVAEGVTVRGDEQALERMTKTLVDNAVKYAGEGGSVLVRLTADRRDHPVLSVHNTGAPIAPDDLAHVFDRFWRSDAARSRESSGGYGLGLAIAKSIAERHGARISATSTEQDGTTFTVAF